MSRETSLPVLLSQVLVAFAIEFDNEFEQRMKKTWARAFGVSIVMWSNFMRFVRPEGTALDELVALSGIRSERVASVIGGMERWGYITVDHDPANGVPPKRKGFGTGRGVKPGTVIRPSMAGQVALDSWDRLVAEIEGRWKARLGDAQVEGLRSALDAVNDRSGLPRFLPVVASAMFAHHELEAGTDEADRDLPALLSRVLLAFTLDFEDGSHVSLPIGANVLRVADEDGHPVADLPLLAGVSKEAVSTSMTWLTNAGYITVEPNPGARGKLVRLTSDGRTAQEGSRRRLGHVEGEWEKRHGNDKVATLRGRLRTILEHAGGGDGPLSAGLVTPAGGWRGTGRYEKLTAAFIESPRDALPRHPMVLHRGGWPDGS
jgi:DNA-binding MarR family transcriptional regulator